MKISGPMTSRNIEDREQEAGIAQARIFPVSLGGHAPGLAGRSQAPRRSRRAPAGRKRSSTSPTSAAISRKAEPAFKERCDRYLVGGVEDGRLRAARGQAPARARPSAGKRSRSGASKASAPIATRSSRCAGRRHPLGPGQGMGDRHPHVGRAELGEHRAVDIFDQAVDHRLRDGRRSRSRRRRPGRGGRPRSARAPCSSGSRESTEILAPIDQLGWATASAGRRRAHLARAARSRNGPPLAVRMIRRTLSGRALVEALEDRIMLGIDRQQGRAARRARPRIISAPAETRASLLASATVPPPSSAAITGLSPARADDRRHRPVGAGGGGLERRACSPAAASMPRAGERRPRARRAGGRRRSRRRRGADAVGQLRRGRRRRDGRSARPPRSARGCGATRSSVERPTEPVAPRMVTLRRVTGCMSTATARPRRRPARDARAASATGDQRRRAGRRAGRARRHGRAAGCRCP